MTTNRRRMIGAAALAGLGALLALSPAGASAQPRRHERIVAVPAGGKVAVDGDLSDWDLSGAVESVFDEALAPRFSVTLALMYDAEALYLAAHFVDDSPLRNAHDPKVEPNRGWAGDCLQVRLCSDPKADYPLPASNGERICHLTMWQFTGRKLPVLHVQYGMDFHGTKLYTGAESGLALRADKDGKGYTLEGRIPWGRLNAASAPPRGGDRIAVAFQPLWGDRRGDKQVCTYNDVVRSAGFSYQGCSIWGSATFSPTGNLPPAKRPRSAGGDAKPLTAELPLDDAKARSLSAAVVDAAGTVVRTLGVVSGPEADAKGRAQVPWDGLDDDGRPLPAGKYRLRWLTHRGIGQRWVCSLHNAGNPPWRTDDGRGSWGGDHGPPIAAACDDERVYLGWTISEAGWAVIALKKDLTADGRVQKLWGQHQVLDIGMHVTALAVADGCVFAAQDGRRWGQKAAGTNTAGVVLWDARTGRPVNFPFGKRALLVSEWKESLLPPELATHERLSIFHPLVPQKRFWQRMRDRDFGPQELGWNLLGVAVVGDELYASLHLEDKVAVINWRTGKHVRDVPVSKPAGLAAAADGSVLAVSDRWVVRIDRGASKAVPVVRDGLRRPWGLATGAGGRIYVTDCGDAMQVKVFDSAGKAAGTIGKAGGRPWVGRYEPEGMLRPAGITVDAAGKAWVAEYDSTPKRVSVWSREGKLLADLLGGGAYAVEGIADEARPRYVNVHHTLFDVDYATGRTRTLATLIRPQMHGFSFTPDGGYMGRALKFRHVRGRTFLVHAGRGGVVIYALDDRQVARPVSAVGPGGALPLHGFTKQDIPESVREDFWRNSHAYAFWWADANGDRLVQASELALEKVKPFWGLYWGSWVDEKLTIWSAGAGRVWRVPVEKWLACDVPAYPKPSAHKPLFEARGSNLHHVMPDTAAGAVYVLEQAGGDDRGGGVKWAAVSRYDLEGRRLWAYRRAWLGFGLEAPLARPGDVVGAMKFIGTAKLGETTLVGVNGYFGQFNLLSDSGLWVASLCKDNRYGPKADATTVWPENFSGCLFRHRDSGKVYLIAGDTDARIWEITGLETIRTGEADLTISTAEHALAARAAMKRQHLKADLPAIRMPRAKAVTVDGDLADWDLASAVTIDAGAGRTAKAALAYDGKSLLIAFDVRDDSPMRNGGKDAALLFKTGDVCDVMLATDPSAEPTRRKPAPGDVRLSLAEVEGKGVCVLYEPAAKRAKKAPRVFSSPTGAEAFGHVAVVAEAQVAVKRRADGYTLEAAVSLTAIALAARPGTTLRGDVGVIYSDAGGSRNVLRAYYANKATAIVNDIPSEARLTPDKWGRIVVGKEAKR